MNGVQAAVIQTGKSLVRELAPIRVNVIAPGVVLTNVWQKQERRDLVLVSLNSQPNRPSVKQWASH